MTLETLEIQPLTPDATVTRTHDSDAGLDLHCIEDFSIDGLGRIMVGTGIAINLPEGYMARVCPRSGLAKNYGIDILGGIIDAGYRGEIKVILHNTSTSRVNFRCGDRIAQLVITPVETPESARSSTLPTRRNVEETDSARPDDERRAPVMKRNIYNIHGQRLRDTQASMLVHIVETHRMPSSASYAKPWVTLGSSSTGVSSSHSRTAPTSRPSKASRPPTRSDDWTGRANTKTEHRGTWHQQELQQVLGRLLLASKHIRIPPHIGNHLRKEPMM